MDTITVKDLIEILSRCDPNAIVVGHVEHKEYTFAIEVVEQFPKELILRCAEEEAGESEESCFSNPHYSKNYSIADDVWSGNQITSVVYLREKWFQDDETDSSIIYMRKDEK